MSQGRSHLDGNSRILRVLRNKINFLGVGSERKGFANCEALYEKAVKEKDRTQESRCVGKRFQT